MKFCLLLLLSLTSFASENDFNLASRAAHTVRIGDSVKAVDDSLGAPSGFKMLADGHESRTYQDNGDRCIVDFNQGKATGIDCQASDSPPKPSKSKRFLRALGMGLQGAGDGLQGGTSCQTVEITPGVSRTRCYSR